MSLLVHRLGNCVKLYKYFLTLVIVFILFLQIALTKLTPLPNFFDEIVLLCIFVYAFYRSSKDEVVSRLFKLYVLAFTLFFLLSLWSIPMRGITNVLLQIFIHLKYILFVIFAWSAIGCSGARNLSFIFIIITTVFLILNLTTGTAFNEIFDLPIQNRGGGVRPVGIQADTASLGTTFSIIGCLAIAGFRNSKTTKIIILFMISALILLSSVRAALLLVPLIILWWLKDSIKSFAIAFVLIVIGFFTFKSNNYVDELIDITTQNIEWTVDNPVESGYIRGIMIFFSFEVANERFPVGAGAATYGTVTSDDSHIYAEIGMHNSRFFVEKEGIYDSNLASLLGEFGYLGFVIYLFIFYLVVTTPAKFKKYEQEDEFKFVFSLLVIGYGVATPIFMNTYPAFILALVLVGSYKKIRNE